MHARFPYSLYAWIGAWIGTSHHSKWYLYLCSVDITWRCNNHLNSKWHKKHRKSNHYNACAPCRTGKFINNRHGKDPRTIQNKRDYHHTDQSLKPAMNFDRREKPRATFPCHKQLYFGVHIQDWIGEPTKQMLSLQTQLHRLPTEDFLEL